MAISLNASSTTGLIVTPDNSGIFAFQKDGTEYARISATGNVGIGTQTPAYPLDVVGNINVSGTVAMASSFKRNRIINGNMQIWQRGTSFSANGYTADRWSVGPAGGTVTVTQVAGPSGFGFQYAAQITGGSGVTTCPFSQRIESYNISDLASKTVTLQVVISASTSQTVLWQASYPTAVDNYTSITSISSGSFSVTTTPTLYTVQISLPSQVTNGLQIVFAPNNGGTFTSGTITFTGVQLEVGTKATPYEMQIYSDQLAQCQRYFSKSYDIATVPGTVTDNGAGWNYVFQAATITDIGISIPLKVTMRTAPTVVWYSPSTGSSGVCGSQAGDKTANSAQIGSSSIAVYITASNNNGQIRAHYTAAAEL